MRCLLAPCAFALIGVGTLACRDSATPPPVPASLAIVSGAEQHGVVATELDAPLVVRVLDRDGQPIAGQAVTFAVTAGGGTLSVAGAPTNGDGIVQTSWTLGTSTADGQTAEARVLAEGHAAPLLVAVFHATASPAAPDTVRVVSGDGQQAIARTALAEPLVARVVDRYGNPAPGAAVAWTVTPDGTFSRRSDTTSSAGDATAELVAGSQVGDATVVAAVGGHSARFLAHIKPVPLTLADLVGRHDLISVDGKAVPARFPVTVEKGTTIESGWLEILPNQTAVFREYSTYSDCAGSLSSNTLTSGAVTVNGDTLEFASGRKAGVSSTGITLAIEYPAQDFGQRIYARASSASALPPAGVGTSVIAVSGDAQSGRYGSLLPAAIVVQVVDVARQPVSGQVVRFDAGAGTLTHGLPIEDATTDAAGMAQVRWTLASLTGIFPPLSPTQTLRAIIVSNVPGVPVSSVTFSATALP